MRWWARRLEWHHRYLVRCENFFAGYIAISYIAYVVAREESEMFKFISSRPVSSHRHRTFIAGSYGHSIPAKETLKWLALSAGASMHAKPTTINENP